MSTTSAPPPPPKLSKEQIALIRASPIHRQIKHRVYSILAISALGFLGTLGVVVFSCILAGPLLKEHRWLIFHYVMANLFAALWFVYAGIHYRDVKFGAWSDQLKIDGGWISVSRTFSPFRKELLTRFRDDSVRSYLFEHVLLLPLLQVTFSS